MSRHFVFTVVPILCSAPVTALAQGSPPGAAAPETEARPAAEAPPPSEAPAAGAAASGEATATPASVPATVAPVPAPDSATTRAAAAATATAATATTTPPVPAPAAPPPAVTPPSPLPLHVTGSFFSRYEQRDGYDRLGVSGGRFVEGDAVAYRARLGLMTAPIDIGRGNSVELAFTPQASGFWGQLPSTVADAAVGLHEGFLRLKTPAFHVDVGRFVMNYGDSLVIGSLEWHQTARSFDGGRFHVPFGSSGAYVDFFGTQLAEGREGPDTGPAAGDAYLTGAYFGLGPLLDEGFELDAYLLGSIVPRAEDQPVDPDDPTLGTADQDTAAQATLGARVKHQVGRLDYRMETGIQAGKRPALGENPKALAGHFDLELGVKPVAPLRVALEGLYATGDDPSTTDAEGWDQLYPTAHKWLGLADIFGARTNIYGGVLHASVTATESLTFKAQGHSYWRPRNVDRNSYAGSEIDTHAIYAIGTGLKLRGMYAIFIPSEDHYADDTVAHYLEVELRYDLK